MGLALVLCEVYYPKQPSVACSVTVRDTNNQPTSLEIQRDFVAHRDGKTWLPIGVVYRDKEKGSALIEFPVEANSGAHRIWVPLTALREPNPGAA
jgi:hypothetical protein